MNYQQELQRIEQEVSSRFEKQGQASLVFHNLVHTRRVVAHCVELAGHYDLSQQQRFIVQAAGWFHDIGYLSGPQQDHELRGADSAGEFLQCGGVSGALIEQIQGCILATRLPQQPTGLLQQIGCDADLYHFGTIELPERDQLMRKEVEIRLGKQIPESAWLAATMRLLEAHHFHTHHARVLLDEGKKQNLSMLQARLGRLNG
ncbi:MAG: hypothetical protein BGO21_05435 [Dyadobacter sp. 50-39]|uniref:HD domain-containing protein n=1 Tax=Dyadobacter sp. 50-39 TaxID=1895756 RepID=UPI000966A28C|nr:HD domain-containing protein [Dyadobacter sp. 50-39]OJV22598.1 MAG: hypothetical protein BGO21_05435 [Dyadobacter sp. 50-39]